MKKPILCLDFDGVIHSYKTGWKGATVIDDPPVDGALEFIVEAAQHFHVNIFSWRSNEPGGILAMQLWLSKHFVELHIPCPTDLVFPTTKPPAKVTIDDRAITFTGSCPAIEDLKNFKPWNMK